MIITAYSTHHRGYTAYRLPRGHTLTFIQLTGYHSTPQEAKLWATTHPNEPISSARTSGIVGTVTGRFSSLRPEFQDHNHSHSRRAINIGGDYAEIEKRILSHYVDPANMTATQAAEARDKFNEVHPEVKQFWDGIKAITPTTVIDQMGNAFQDQRKPPSGRRDDLDLSERASRDPSDPRTPRK